MMKSRTLAALTFALLVCATGQARKYGMAGCGLGSYVAGAGSSAIASVFGHTTNHTSWNQAIGLLAESFNCLPDEGEKASLFQESFVTANFATLSKEMAQGNGETLVAFSDALGCRREAFVDVASQLKGSYAQILSSPGAISALEAAKGELRRNPQTAQACSHIS